jgi:hypothetical protein
MLPFLRRPKPRSLDRVIVTDEAVTHLRLDGGEEIVRWDELQEVGVMTTDLGPSLEDVFFVLIPAGEKAHCVVPQAAEGIDEMLKRLWKLKDFDDKAFIDAMSSTSNASFVCWKRPSGSST